MKSLVIIPTYNEIENVEQIIRKVHQVDASIHMLIIDDGSPDGTADKVRALQTEFPDKLFLLTRAGKLGLGTAYITGFKWAIERGYDYIFEMDCDFSHNPEDLPRLREACVQGADLAVGSRYVKGGQVKNWPLDRIILSFGGSIYVRLVTWMPVRDTTAGFVCYTRKFLDAIDLSKITFTGYSFQIQMKFAAYKSGFKIKEVPITFVDRVHGVSKMSSNIVKEAISGVLKMQWDSLFSDYFKK